MTVPFRIHGNPLVARKQGAFVAAVEAQQPHRRPLLVQPLRTNPILQQKTPWVPLADAGGEELWTTSIALNEVVFDFDSTDWSQVRYLADRVCAVLDDLGAKYHAYLTGGKGVHIHAWLDFSTLRADAGLFERAVRADVCPFSSARETFAESVLDVVGLPKKARWSTDKAGGMLDRLKVRWSASRSGSMIRVPGCKGKRGFRKTLVDVLPEHLPDIEVGGVCPPTRIPGGPAPAYVIPAPLSQRMVRDLQSAVGAAEAALASTPKCLDAKRLEDVPCVLRTMQQGVGHGSRHAAHLNLVVTAHRLGYTAEEAAEALGRAVALHGLSEGDSIEKLVQQVYTGRWRAPPNLSCPSPLVSGLCDPNACALSRHMAFE